jgi:polysaccharide pyruvyl transferase WcaK-like protein
MHVIVDNGAYTLRNMGGVAMLQACVKRIRSLHPNALIRVLLTDYSHLQRYCPGTTPLSVDSRDAFFEGYRATGSSFYERWRSLRKLLRFPPTAQEFARAFSSVDAVVVAGGGFLNDINPIQTRSVLRMLVAAGRRGYRTALFGQGLGPLQNPEFVGLLGQACRHGTRLGLRESLRGSAIAQAAGVAPDFWSVTGDDAVEMAWAARKVDAGSSLGFSLRQADYAALQDGDCEVIRSALINLRSSLAAELVPVPISFNSWENDPMAIASIVGTEAQAETALLDHPESLIAQAARCRVMLSGTYHGAVFSLSQGIPTLCLFRSPYYRYKMEGLAAQFPFGCEVLDLAAEELECRIIDAVRRLWDSADGLRLPLLASAESQVNSSKRFYQSTFSPKA